MVKKVEFIVAFVLIFNLVTAQDKDSLKFVDYSNPKEYIVDTVIITGVHFLDKNVLANMSGFEKGAKIMMPGDDISKIIRKYWEHGLFEDVKVSITKLVDNKVALNILLRERPRLSRLSIEGVSKSDKDDLKEKLNLRLGTQITQDIINNCSIIIKKFYTEKGFFNVEVNIKQDFDTIKTNRVDLTIRIDKNKKVKIGKLFFTGNNTFKTTRLKRTLKKTKVRDWKFWNSSKFIETQYKEDKGKLIEFYNERGYRDAKILSDSVVVISKNRVAVYINMYEGDKYYFRNISWVGNTKYTSEFLSEVLTIKKGNIFNQKFLDKRLQSDEDAVSSLYLDNGYLFFNVDPVEVMIENDSIDFEMRISEGRQATINEIIISGNTKTNEHVVRREIRTLPAELFSKSDIIRTVRELATLGHFEPEKIEPVPLPNPANATVDIQYKLVERANDQLEVSGGWGGYTGFIGTIGVRFSNFSYRNFFKWKEWRPVPSGDGQTLSLRLQTNGTYYRSYSATFADPWFGGKKPNSLSVSGTYTHYAYNSSSLSELISSSRYMNIIGASVALGKRLRWPDDYFTIQNEINYEYYELKDYQILPGFANGSMHNFNYAITLGRNSLDQLIYPRTGSSFSLRFQFTPPYSWFKKEYFWVLSPAERFIKDSQTKVIRPMTTAEVYEKEQEIKYHFIEYDKWTFKAETYLSLVGNLVLMSRANFGFLGRYTKSVGYSPVDKYKMGGSGLNTYAITSVDIVAMRGYEDGALTPDVDNNNNLMKSRAYENGGNLYDKYTFELRYPVTLKESATIYGLSFVEAGNCWNKFEAFNPFDVKRSVGFGIRIFLPMFGLLGFDMGYGFDKVYNQSGMYEKSGWQPHFTLGQQF
jgi:outer membrane protein insertion porin family